MKDWKAKVYGKKEDTSIKIEESILNGFCVAYNYQCQACRKRYSKKSGILGLHHIIPRAEGGLDDDDNLVLLCAPCHDIIEPDWEKYKSYSLISHCFAKRKPKHIINRTETGTNWQQWVYGGKRNPLYG